MMATTDLALVADPAYRAIAARFHANFDEFADAFARAWFKLTHRDMGPRSRYLGPLVPDEHLIWQDPVPAVDHDLVDPADVEVLKAAILATGMPVGRLVRTAWASASSFRGTDKRGGANGARVRLEPQRSWEVNDPSELGETIAALEQVQREFNESQHGATRVSLADVIVLAGCAAIEHAARAAGRPVTVAFAPGRTDATAAMTDVASFRVLEPVADGFRNWVRPGEKRGPEHLLIDRANLLTLTPMEMTALIGGMRALDANAAGTTLGVLTSRPGQLTNDVFVNLLDVGTDWTVSASDEGVYEGRDRATGDVRWRATAVDLVFGHSSRLRALAEVYASDDGEALFVRDFIAAWDKVMTLDRFDLL